MNYRILSLAVLSFAAIGFSLPVQAEIIRADGLIIPEEDDLAKIDAKIAKAYPTTDTKAYPKTNFSSLSNIGLPSATTAGPKLQSAVTGSSASGAGGLSAYKSFADIKAGRLAGSSGSAGGNPASTLFGIKISHNGKSATLGLGANGVSLASANGTNLAGFSNGQFTSAVPGAITGGIDRLKSQGTQAVSQFQSGASRLQNGASQLTSNIGRPADVPAGRAGGGSSYIAPTAEDRQVVQGQSAAAAAADREAALAEERAYR